MSFDTVAHSKATLTINEGGQTDQEEKIDREQELEEIREFEEQDFKTQWFLRGAAIVLLCALAFMWIYYR